MVLSVIPKFRVFSDELSHKPAILPMDFSLLNTFCAEKFFKLLRHSVIAVIRNTALLFFRSKEICHLLKILDWRIFSLCLILRLIFITVFFQNFTFRNDEYYNDYISL